MTRVTNDELMCMRDICRAVDSCDDPGDPHGDEFDDEIVNRADRIADICDELLMLRASQRLQAGAAGAREEFLSMAPHIKFPLRVSEDTVGGIVDDAGADVAFMADEGPAEAHMDGTAAMIVLAVNSCAGFRAEPAP